MKPFVVYDATTGAIARTGFAPDKNFPALVRPGEALLVGSGTASAHYVDVATASICQKKPVAAVLAVGEVDVGGSFRIEQVMAGSTLTVTDPAGNKTEQSESNGVIEVVATIAGAYSLFLSHANCFARDFFANARAAAIPE